MGATTASIVEQQKQSQLSIKPFCENNSINYQTFFYWSKRLRSHETVQTLHPIAFDEPRHSPSEVVVLLFANGIRAELPAALSPV
ncbi:IS66 family insertion sequence element accessory protein TnpA [Shewanella electrica]|uniref:IS66 family insertion sequence element accessory protein TnpA n=1 Tax=Shewanella electrica TaxID=515560 RepID=UPI003F69EA45